MLLFYNPLLEEEVSPIYNNNLPNHNTIVEMMIHTEKDDFTASNVIGMDVKRDYEGDVVDNIQISMMLGLGEYNRIIDSNRDKLQITAKVNYNGRVYEDRYKAVVLTNDVESMRGHTNETKDTFSMIEVTFQCIPLAYALLRNRSSAGVISNASLSDIMKHHLSKALANMKINSKSVTPIIDIVPIHNTRKYPNVMIPNKIEVMDIPLELQKKYGVYNGGIGVYLYTNNEKKTIISVYPLYNTDAVPSKRKLVVYIPDKMNPSKTLNKTVVLDNDELLVIASSETKTVGRKDDIADFDYGSGYSLINSNQVMDRVMDKKNGKVTSKSENFVDAQKVKTKNDMTSTKTLDNTDNTYAVRSINLLNKSYIRSIVWNFSRPDYLIPGMKVDIVTNDNNRTVRVKGVLMSSHSRYDNKYQNCTTRLNIRVN